MSAVPWIKVYRLTPIDAGDGIACDERGVFVGGVPLLRREREDLEDAVWVPRPVHEINSALCRRYGVPVDFTSRLPGLHGVAKALNRSEFGLAMIATLHLRLPDPQPRETVSCCVGEILKVVEDLRNVGLLKADWDPARHPRWPAGASDSRGGQFAPIDSTTISPAPNNAPGVIPAQATVPWFGPWDVPMDIPWRMPAPSDILPPTIDIPNQQERTRPPLVNPFPRKRKCVEEWDEALDFCERQEKDGKLKPGYGGFGKDFNSCVRGRVSEECGGNRFDA